MFLDDGYWICSGENCNMQIEVESFVKATLIAHGVEAINDKKNSVVSLEGWEVPTHVSTLEENVS